MYFDASIGKTVLFGGANVDIYNVFPNFATGANLLGDLWVYDYPTNTWTQMSTSNGPTARYLHMMGYDPIAQDVRAVGQSSFHLACPDFRDQFLILRRPALAIAGAQLKFRSRLGLAAEKQVAEAQISTDEGSSWTTVYRQPGSWTPPPSR